MGALAARPSPLSRRVSDVAAYFPLDLWFVAAHASTAVMLET